MCKRKRRQKLKSGLKWGLGDGAQDKDPSMSRPHCESILLPDLMPKLYAILLVHREARA